jgi:hypothetical protein
MDIHKDITMIVVLNASSHVESRTQVKTKAESFRDFFRGLSVRVEVVSEGGVHSAWLYQLLKNVRLDSGGKSWAFSRCACPLL